MSGNATNCTPRDRAIKRSNARKRLHIGDVRPRSSDAARKKISVVGRSTGNSRFINRISTAAFAAGEG